MIDGRCVAAVEDGAGCAVGEYGVSRPEQRRALLSFFRGYVASERPPDPRRNARVWPAGLLLIVGPVGLWFAETYKPSVTNELGLNGNKFVLKPESVHVIVIVSIVLLVIGGVRLLMAASR